MGEGVMGELEVGRLGRWGDWEVGNVKGVLCNYGY